MSTTSNKTRVLLKLYEQCQQRGESVFSNNDVREACREVGFSNLYDATKIDNTSLLPTRLKNDDVFVVHLGRGQHRFVTGIGEGYHVFEDIPDSCRRDWQYRRSILNAINSSESNILSVMFNQRIIHDFLYQDITVSPRQYNSHRTNVSFNYSLAGTLIRATNLQVEIDFTLEHDGLITVIEAKNGFPADFNIFQLYNAFRYYRRIIDARPDRATITIACCYLLRQGPIVRIYRYTFADLDLPSSIQLIANAEYRLVER